MAEKNNAALETARQAQSMPPHVDTEIFADGVSSIWLRGGVLKIDLYQVTGIAPDSQGEFRRLSQRLSLPVAALAELKAHIQQLEAAITAARQEPEQQRPQ